jgi:hypothetical protein
MTGYKREKRGYTGLLLDEAELPSSLPEPTDPYFQYQWYLVSAFDDDVFHRR